MERLFGQKHVVVEEARSLRFYWRRSAIVSYGGSVVREFPYDQTSTVIPSLSIIDQILLTWMYGAIASVQKAHR